jgi:hypothetical protein
MRGLEGGLRATPRGGQPPPPWAEGGHTPPQPHLGWLAGHPKARGWQLVRHP